MSFTGVILSLKAWPTREERLRKGGDVSIAEPDNLTDVQRKKRARLLKLRSAQRKRRQALQNVQEERKRVPEAE